MSKLDKDGVLAKFTAAYEAANGKAPTIEAKGGWYSVDGGKNIRLAQLEEMADSMETPAPKKATAEKPVKETKTDQPKAAAKTDKPKAPAKAKAKAKKSASSFSVKDFYTKQIQDTNPGAKAPR